MVGEQAVVANLSHQDDALACKQLCGQLTAHLPE